MAVDADTPGTPEDSEEEIDSSSVGGLLREVAFAPRLEPPGAEEARVGETIGRFQLTSLLGRGGMGVVYAATDLTLKRKVALKLLPQGAVESEERRRRFLREAQAAATVSHPNIATVFEVGEVEGAVFIAMERVHGRSLRAVLDAARDAAGSALGEAEATRIAREIARGLAAAHAAGVIHRDIKPENVMLGDGGEVKILDFGLAKLRGGEGERGAPSPSDVTTREGRLLGTPSYMSPEQARGLSADARSDVFSLGIVLFEMLAGKRPFRGATATDVLAAIVRDAPPRLGRLGARGPRVSEALARVVDRCLAKEPSERYAGAGALLADLEAAESIAAHAPARSSRHRWFWLAIPVVIAAMAAWSTLRSGAGARGPLDPAAPAPAPGPTAITDLPLPASSSSAAIAAYQVALRSFRDANWGQAEASLLEALEHDPTLAAAHLRRALILSNLTFTTPEARAAFREAARYRSALTPRDRALLTALEPSLGADPADVAETTRRFTELSERYPLDAEIFNLLGSYHRLDEPALRLAVARRAVEIDPEYADAWQQVGAALAETDPNGAVAALKRCTAIAPTAIDCWGERARLESARGQCADAEAYLRWATSDPRASTYYLRVHAHLLYGLDKPKDVVAEAFRQEWARLDPGLREQEQPYDSALLAAAYGDFDAAMTKAAAGLAQAENQPDLQDHARYALLLTDIALEAGRAQVAAATAADFLKRRDAWHRGVPTDDPTVYLARVLLRSGVLSQVELREQRDAWVRAAKPATAIQKALTWSLAYVDGIEREDEAAEALSARPADARWSIGDLALDAALGRALWLGGKHDEALSHLSRTFTRCDRFPFIFLAMRSDLLFGRALEEQGHRERACEVYQSIIARWGKAEPRSVTAEQAKKRALSLGCAAAPQAR